VLVLLVMPATIVLVVFPRTVLTVVGSSEFTPAATSLQLLAVGVALMAISGLLGHVLLALGKQIDLAKIMPAGLVANVALNLILIPPMGFNGAALATLLTELAVTALLLQRVTRNLAYWPSFSSIGRTAGMAAAGCAIALWLLPDVLVLRAILVLTLMALLPVVSGLLRVGEIGERIETYRRRRKQTRVLRPQADLLARIAGQQALISDDLSGLLQRLTETRRLIYALRAADANAIRTRGASLAVDSLYRPLEASVSTEVSREIKVEDPLRSTLGGQVD
jgi:hypothetical protein